MITLNVWDSNFPHQSTSVACQQSKLFRYVKDQLDFDGVTLFTDGQMFGPQVDAVRSRHKVGWLHEVVDLHPENYDRERLSRVMEKFDFIMTTEQELVDWHPTYFVKIIRGGTRVSQDKWGIYPKSRKVSLIASDKQQTSGHKLRMATASALGGMVDIYGYKGHALDVDKENAYRDYMFAIVLEAANRPDWFTEHLLDCVAYGTIPIYWGCPNACEYLDHYGILTMTNIEQVADLLDKLTPQVYRSLLPHAYSNLLKLSEYAITEEWFIRNVFPMEWLQ